MLKLQQIVKDYQAGDTTVHALRGVSLQFRESEFVAILGHYRRVGSVHEWRPCHQRQVDEGLF